MLSEAKHLAKLVKILRSAQDDKVLGGVAVQMHGNGVGAGRYGAPPKGTRFRRIYGTVQGR